jgi:hypothetical protein
MPFPPDAPQKIRDKVERGALPRTPPARMFAGYGRGELCGGCDHPIQPDDIEYEFVNGKMIRMHIGCAALWQAERRRRDSG